MSKQPKPIKHGSKWRIRPYDENGRRFSEVYDSFAEAVYALERHRVRVKEIKQGLRLPMPQTKSFSELCDYYLTFYSSQKRNVKNDKTIINRHLRPFFGRLDLKDISTHVAEYKFLKHELARKTLHNHLTLLITMLRTAHYDKRWISEIPKIIKPRLKLLDRDFFFLKTDCEIQRLLAAANEDPYVVAFCLYATAVYTGMRAGELAGLEWSAIDFKARQIKVYRSYDGPTKSEETRFVPILDVLLPILRDWQLRSTGKFVFPGENGGMLGPSARVFQEVFKRTLDRAGFERVVRNGKLRCYIRFHDLRHTFASHWMMKGGDIFRLSKILGHADIKMTQRYAHLAPHIYVEDYKRFGEHSPIQLANILKIK